MQQRLQRHILKQHRAKRDRQGFIGLRRRLMLYGQLMRLDRPIGIWLLFWPCGWGLALAAPELSDRTLTLLGWFALGAVLMRGAGCILNDLADRRFDARVARTAHRPLASGALPVYDALCLLALLLALALGVVMQLHPSLLYAAAASLGLVAAYPFMKRITYWPQAFLGLTFNLGVVFGYLAATGSLSPAAGLLYAAAICWTIGYDTLYAHQDIEDDLRVGVKSTAIAFGRHSRLIVGGFYTACALLFGLALWSAGWGAHALIPALLIAAHGGWQVSRVRLCDPASCLRAFRSNGILGGLIWLSMLLTN